MKKQTLILDFLPTDYNTYSDAERRHYHIAAVMKRTDTEFAYYRCKEQRMEPISNRVKIVFTWYVKNVNVKKLNDPDNIAFKKAILDGIVMAGVLKNDSLKEISGFEDRFILGQEEKVIVEFM